MPHEQTLHIESSKLSKLSRLHSFPGVVTVPAEFVILTWVANSQNLQLRVW
jgi:hypothetical protein